MNICKKSILSVKFVKTFFILLSLFLSITLKAQVSNEIIDYSKPLEYEIGGITVSGTQYLDNQAIINLTGLKIGDIIKIPSDKTSKSIDNLWTQGLFSDVTLKATKIQGNLIFLDFSLKEMPRLSHFAFYNVKKRELDDLKEKSRLVKGDIVTENLKMNAINKIKKHYFDKGYFNAEVSIKQKIDTIVPNHVILEVTIKKHNKIKIHKIYFEGNKSIASSKLKRSMKDTKEKQFYNIFYHYQVIVFLLLIFLFHLYFYFLSLK